MYNSYDIDFAEEQVFGPSTDYEFLCDLIS